MNREPLRVGIAGYGTIGKRRRLSLDDDSRVRVVGVCDVLFEGQGTFPDGVAYFPSVAELLELDLDAVFVCLPNDVAPVATAAALQLGRHVFCEKPPGRSVADIERVREVHSQMPHLKLKFGFNHRYHHSVMDALSLIESGVLGNIVNMRGVYGKSAFIPWPRPQAPGDSKDDVEAWRTSRAIAGGGILLDQGIHLLDLMILFAGRFESVKSFVSNSYWHQDVEDNAYALMRTSDGVVAMLHSTATQWRHRFSLEISLEEGAIVLSGILSGTKSYGQETMTVIYREDEANGNPREVTTSYIKDDSWRLEVSEFLDAIVSDGDIVHGTSSDALHSMELVHRIYDSDHEWQSFVASLTSVPGMLGSED